MSQISKVGDIASGVCYAHRSPIPVTGIITTGDSSVIGNGIPIACVGDIVTFNCGHIGTIVNGVNGMLLNNKILAQIGSLVVGPMVATIIKGDSTLIG